MTRNDLIDKAVREAIKLSPLNVRECWNHPPNVGTPCSRCLNSITMFVKSNWQRHVQEMGE